MGDDQCMVDTNVLVFSTVVSNPLYEEARDWLAGLDNRDVKLCITPQIVREYLVTLIRGNGFRRKFTPEEALNELQDILPEVLMLDENERTVHFLCDLVKRYNVKGRNIHDANIAATMLAHGVTRLATYNDRDFRRFQEITLEEPA